MIFVTPQTVIKGTQHIPSMVLLSAQNSEERRQSFERMYHTHFKQLQGSMYLVNQLYWRCFLDDEETHAYARNFLVPIVIGSYEADILSFALDCYNQAAAAPTLAHEYDIFGTNIFSLMIKNMQANHEFFTLFKIYKARGTHFYARAYVMRESGSEYAMDIRVSDACVLSLLTHTMIAVENDVFNQTKIDHPDVVQADHKKMIRESFKKRCDGDI